MPRKIYEPVVALDVDGVISAYAMDPDSLLPGWERIVVDVPADKIPFSPFLPRNLPENSSIEMPLTINPGLHGPWIEDLRKRVNLVWASTWEEMANYVLCPLLGIKPLPVGISYFDEPPRIEHFKHPNPPEWKARTLSRKFSNHEICWIDDQNDWFKGHIDKRRYLGITTDPAIGLTPEQMAKIDRWADNITRWVHGEGAEINATQGL